MRTAVAAVLGIVFLFEPFLAQAKDGEFEGPRICVMAPIWVVAGTTPTLKIRGLKLAEATGVSANSGSLSILGSIKEKKTGDVLTGFEAKDVGDSIVLAEVVLPSGSAGSSLRIRVITPEGTTQPSVIHVVDGALSVEEKEPNNGFRNAQPVAFGIGVLGAIGVDRDVDVFVIKGHAKRTLVAEIFAARAGSLLDGVLTLYDEKGNVLVSSDDGSDGRDPKLRFPLRSDGTYFVALQDASDHGTAWHGYELRLREEP